MNYHMRGNMDNNNNNLNNNMDNNNNSIDNSIILRLLMIIEYASHLKKSIY